MIKLTPRPPEMELEKEKRWKNGKKRNWGKKREKNGNGLFENGIFKFLKRKIPVSVEVNHELEEKISGEITDS